MTLDSHGLLMTVTGSPPGQSVHAAHAHYHKSMSCPYFPQFTTTPSSAGCMSPTACGGLQTLPEQGPTQLHLPDPRTSCGLLLLSPFSDVDELPPHAPTSSTSPSAPPPALLRYQQQQQHAPQLTFSPPRAHTFRAPPAYRHTYQGGAIRQPSCPLSSPPRRLTPPASPTKGGRPSSPPSSPPKEGEPAWLHHLRTLRTPVPWEELGEAWAAASQAEVQQQVLADLPLDVQEDIRQREHQARTERANSITARISRALSKLSLGALSPIALSPIANGATCSSSDGTQHRSNNLFVLGSSSTPGHSDGSSGSGVTSRQPSTTLYANGGSCSTSCDALAGAVAAVEAAGAAAQANGHWEARAIGEARAMGPSLVQGLAAAPPAVAGKAWDMLKWFLGRKPASQQQQQRKQQAAEGSQPEQPAGADAPHAAQEGVAQAVAVAQGPVPQQDRGGACSSPRAQPARECTQAATLTVTLDDFVHACKAHNSSDAGNKAHDSTGTHGVDSCECAKAAADSLVAQAAESGIAAPAAEAEALRAGKAADGAAKAADKAASRPDSPSTMLAEVLDQPYMIAASACL